MQVGAERGLVCLQGFQTYVTGDKIGQAWNALKLYEITDKAPPSVAQIMEHYGFVDGEIKPVGSNVLP